MNGQQFFQSYLVSYLFWLGIPLGSLALLMLHNLTGGGWGSAIRPYLETAVATLPLTAFFFIPLLLGLDFLYPWAHASSDLLEKPLNPNQQLYLQTQYFILRALI